MAGRAIARAHDDNDHHATHAAPPCSGGTSARSRVIVLVPPDEVRGTLLLIQPRQFSLSSLLADREKERPWPTRLRSRRMSVCSVRPATPAQSSCACSSATPGRDRAPHRRPAGRAGDAPGVSAVLPLCAAASAVDREHRLEGRRPRPDLLRAAACHHPESSRADLRRATRDQGGRPLRRFPAGRYRRLRPLVRPRASRARVAAARRLRPGRGLPRGDQPGRSWWPIPDATPPAHSFRSSRCCGRRRSTPTRS